MALFGTETKRSGRVTDTDGRQVNIDAGGIADTVGQGLQTAAPVINTNLAVAAGVSGGVYRVSVTAALTGTAETSTMNLALRTNGVAVAGSIPSITGQVVKVEFPRITAQGNFTVTNLVAGIAGSVYAVNLLATRVE